MIIVGIPEAREIVSIDAESGALLARLPLPIAPSRFCFNPDGGRERYEEHFRFDAMLSGQSGKVILNWSE